MKISPKTKNLLWHTLGISLFIVNEQGLLVLTSKDIHIGGAMLFYAIDIPFIYLASGPFISNVVKNLSYPLKAAVIAATVFVGYGFFQQIAGALFDFYSKGTWSMSLGLPGFKIILARFIYLSGIATAIYLAKDGILKAKQVRELEIRQLQSEKNALELEAAYLHTQINPHLLFNTLNYLDHLVGKLSTKASTAIGLLSEIMHYALREIQNVHTVKLDEEIDQVNKYLALINLRKEQLLQLSIKVPDNNRIRDVHIPPLILITILENMLKHGDLYNKDQPAELKIQIQEEIMLVRTFNFRKHLNNTKGHGIGLENMRKRLALLYHERHSLSINETPNTFELNLTIPMIL